jgi:transcriptional regulator with XRE-family HTH domain
MTSQYERMNPRDRAIYGYARVRDIAFDAVQALWRRRRSEGVTQLQLAEALGKDTGWVSKNLRGPGNWTLRTVGEFVEALRGEIEITIHALEDRPADRPNYNAYLDYNSDPLRDRLPQAPSQEAIKLNPEEQGLIKQRPERKAPGDLERMLTADSS